MGQKKCHVAFQGDYKWLILQIRVIEVDFVYSYSKRNEDFEIINSHLKFTVRFSTRFTTFLLAVRTSTDATATKLSLPPEIVIFVFKVIPLFCTAHPLLCIILWHPVPASTKRTNKGRFCRAKAFIRNNNAADRLTASWFAIEKQENERNVRDPEVCSGFSLRGRRVVELLKCPGWGFGLWGLWSLWDSSTALQLH